MLNYVSWISLFSLSAQLMLMADLPEKVSVDSSWKVTSEYGLSSPGQNKGLELTFYLKDSKITLVKYILIPWQDLVSSNMLGSPLIGVNPFAVIYKNYPAGVILNQQHQNLYERIDLCFNKLIGMDEAGQEATIEHRPSAFDGIRIVEMTQYAYWIDLQIAEPGSNRSVIGDIIELFPGKMVRISLIPDQGPAKTFWRRGAVAGNSCFSVLEGLFLDSTKARFSKLLQKPDLESVQGSFTKSLADLEQLTEAGNVDGDCRSTLKSWMRRFYYFPDLREWQDDRNIFPDYVPKQGPDTILDFEPGLRSSFAQIPHAEAASIQDLIKFYRRIKRRARRNPGKWEEGNIVLGASPKEYHPSHEEFLLMEVGSRIIWLFEHSNSGELAKYLNKLFLKPRVIQYREFSVTHVDVMGSGRFFYVSEINEIKHKIK
ncbi:MAG: hypothetical protein HN936_01760 [Bacteroidetes bacterium]|jgi:hypothetical protein|nr:hypothetical protein [Bacteroidota bacterium]MBT4399612.1 hypothetical protein [Bacteroidota bacterium]MBT4409754.1 hypothetical protein [Bacteroidota bacterium]MBT5425588.1 hypothetical protein [Bacteroidota bacterium]MBT7091942.1 hypothetical protein [Bacteroidota bacterium]